MRKVTLQDMAGSLGVARSTVSRALRADPQISMATRTRVQRLAAELGYRPNAAARALIRRSAGVVGLVLPRTSTFVFSNPYFSDLLEGIASVAEDAGFPILVSASVRPDYALWLREGRVDGIITLGSSLDRGELALLERVAERGSPVVLVHPAGVPSPLLTVTTDEAPGLRGACRHLLDSGHREVAVVTGPTRSPYARARAEGWRRAAESVGMQVTSVVNGDDTLVSGVVAAHTLLRSRRRATAWLLGNDLMALGALEALCVAKVAVPDELSVVGFDDILPATLLGLSTVHQGVRELGVEAMRALRALMERAPTHPPRLGTRFVSRRTSGPVAAGMTAYGATAGCGVPGRRGRG